VIFEFVADAPGRDELTRIVFPVISKSSEKFELVSSKQIHIYKERAVVKISSDSDIEILPTTGNRVFNFVPGVEAIPLAINQSKCRIEIVAEVD
jgi:hypothetical protein